MTKLLQSLVLAASIGITSLGATPALAAPAVFTVNSLSDGADGVPGDGKCETREKTCTLRAAIMEANQHEFSTIKLGAGVHVLSIPGIDEDNARQGDLDIKKPMIIEGVGPQSVVDGRKLDRVFETFATGGPKYAVTMSKFTIQGGKADGQFLADEKGGGVRNHGTLSLTEMLFRNNSANECACYVGGAILNKETGHLLMVDSVLTDNVGMGAFANWGVADVRKSTIKRTNLNAPDRHGGGVVNSGKLTMFDSSIVENRGGGISPSGSVQPAYLPSELVLERVTIANNTDGVHAGAVAVHEGTATLTNVTVSNNAAETAISGGERVGGIRVLNAKMTLQNVTLVDNKGTGGGVGGLKAEYNAAVKVSDTILANNANGDCWGNILALEVNLIETPGNCIGLMSPHDITGVDPKLGPLQDNGGFTKTHALLVGSKAIDAHASLTAPKQDQRGKSRPVNTTGAATAKGDLGAFEVQ